MTSRDAKKRLALIWFGFTAGLIVFVFAQTIGRHYEKPETAWAWLVPSVVPTVSLIVGVLVSDAKSTAPDGSVDPFLFRLASLASWFYLSLVLATLVFAPAEKPSQFLTLSQLWLGPVQGVTLAALGVFFRHGEKG